MPARKHIFRNVIRRRASVVRAICTTFGLIAFVACDTLPTDAAPCPCLDDNICCGGVCVTASTGCTAADGGNDDGGNASGDAQLNDAQPTDSYGVPTPSVESVSAPAMMSIGSELQISGNGFCDPAQGMECEPVVAFSGTYETADGTEDVHVTLTQDDLLHVNDSQLGWVFGPGVPFSADNKLGTFVGTVTVTNWGLPGYKADSDPYDIALVVGPSIIVRRFGSPEKQCDSKLTQDILNQQGIILEIEALGLTEGSATKPLLFGYTLLRDMFSFGGALSTSGTNATDPEGIVPTDGIVGLVHQVVDGTRRSVIGGGLSENVQFCPCTVDLPSSDNATELADELLAKIPTNDEQSFTVSDLTVDAQIDDSENEVDMTIHIVATDGTTVVRRSIPIRVWAPLRIEYDGNKTYEPLPPTQVCDCVQAGSSSATVRYSENGTETRLRSISLELISNTSPLFPSSALTGLVSARMGIDLNHPVSSATLLETPKELEIFPGDVAVCYRSTAAVQRFVSIEQNNVCGEPVTVGSAVINDWKFFAEIAKAAQSSCDPPPRPSTSIFD